MEQFSQIFIMSFVVVSIYDIIKSFYKDNKIDINSIVTAVSEVNNFEKDFINFAIPYLGKVLTGLVISKGSNYVYDFITKIISLINGKAIAERDEDENVG